MRGIVAPLCLLWMTALAQGQSLERDGTRLEMGERFCGRHVQCRLTVNREIGRGRTVQQVILALGDAIYRNSPENAERAYDAMTRCLQFAHDFMSHAEMEAGQVRYLGADVETLRDIMGQGVWICESRGNWLSRFLCLRKRIASFLPFRY